MRPLEGFGLAVLEAMACGAPVITSYAGALPEVAGEAALQVDPTSVEGMAEAMRMLLDEQRRSALGKWAWSVPVNSPGNGRPSRSGTFYPPCLMPRIALVIDALSSFTGAEKVLAAALDLYPEAPIYTLAYDTRAFVGRPIEGRAIHTSWIQRLPGARRTIATICLSCLWRLSRWISGL